MALESVWEVTLLEIFFTFDLVWVPGFGMVPQTCFSVVSLKYEAMEHGSMCTILNNFVGVALQ